MRVPFYVIWILFAIGVLTAESDSNKTDASKEKNGTEFEDRINLNLNYGVANAYRPGGGVSSSNAASYGVSSGLLWQDGRYQHLSSQTGSQANNYNSGRGPPNTYANTGSYQNGPYSKGNAGAGYSGGIGNAFAGSQSDRIAIQLGLGGPVLLSNLQPLNSTRKGNQIKTIEIPTAPKEAEEGKPSETLFFRP